MHRNGGFMHRNWCIDPPSLLAVSDSVLENFPIYAEYKILLTPSRRGYHRDNQAI